MAQAVREIMTLNPVALPTSASVREAAERMRDKDIGDVIVLEDKSIYGIVTDRDMVVRALAEGKDPQKTTIGEICSRDPTTVSPDEDAEKAVQLMRDKAIRRLPVVEKGSVVGVLSIGDLAVERDRSSALADISAAAPNN